MKINSQIEMYRNHREMRMYINKYTYEVSSSKALRDCSLFLTRHKVDLFYAFLINLPKKERYFYDCYQFLSFFNKYASLAYIDKNGDLKSVIWNEKYYTGPFRRSVKACRLIVEKSVITREFKYDYKNSTRINNDTLQVGDPDFSGFYITLNTSNIIITPKESIYYVN